MKQKLLSRTAILNTPDTMIFGIGNSGRSDDGLGWAFLDAIQKAGGFKGQILFRYQLQVEDAECISRARQVIFVDAYHGKLEGGVQWSACLPTESFAFTTHVLPPEAVLFLCQDLYGELPPAHILLIEGTVWDLQIGLTPEAQVNLDRALQFFEEKLSMG